MRKRSRRFAIFSIILVAGLMPLPGLHAQEDPAAAVDSGSKLETTAMDLASTIAEKEAELARLRDQITSTTGDERKALRERAYELIDEYMTDLGALVENVVEREASGLDVADDRAKLSSTLERTSEVLRRSITDTQTELEALRSSREDASAEELDKSERASTAANAWLDRTLDMLLDLTETMEEFGIEAATEREFLTGHLTDRAELVAGQIMLAQERVEKIKGRLKVDPSSTELIAESDRLEAGRDRYVARLTTTTRMMETFDLDTADYQQLLFQVTGEITTGLLSREVIGGLLTNWGRSTMDWITANGPSLILKAVLFFLILFVFRILSRVARKMVRKAINRSNLQVSVLLERTALSMTGSLVMIFGLLVALSQLGFQVAPLLAGLGVAGFIIGFALQDTLSNFASGMMILLYRPYDVGDLIETAGAMGKVENMTLVSTTILTVDHQTLVIPNSMIWGNVIKNVTAQSERRIDMVFGIGYADDIPHAERVLTEILKAHEQVLDDPEPVVKLHNLGESSVDFVVRPWVKTDDYWDVYWDITREVKIRFDAEKISIPFPQRDVHLFKEGGDE
jgi:small conductance mechanosensitive channel